MEDCPEDFYKAFCEPPSLQVVPEHDPSLVLPRILYHFFDGGGYVRESDEYSKAICCGLHIDLGSVSPLFSQRIEHYQECFALNSPISDLKNGNEWDDHAWDYVVGPAGVSTTQRLRASPGLRLQKLGIPTFSSPLLFIPETPTKHARIALEAKAIIKRQMGSVPNRFRDLALDYRWVHEHDDRTIAVALVILEAGYEASKSIEKLLRLKLRDRPGEPGLDVLMIVPYGKLAPPPHTEYGYALKRLARLYEERFGLNHAAASQETK